ncbi:MAG: 2-hydroxyacyl-CoA dehydratase [Desulfuromonadaceae bacterium]
MSYTIKEFIGSKEWKFEHHRPVVGLDLGSRASKGVLLTSRKIYTTLIPTGLYMQETADELLKKLLRLARVKRSDLAYIVSTGYGRIALEFSDIPFEVVTEISCHAMGAHALYPTTRTIIDIGGQDSKAIKVDTETGKVVDFVMNDKCAAGTGQFLEKAAVLLGLTLDELGSYSLNSTDPAQISSQCVVFAESEMISLRAKGAKTNDKDAVANIAAGIHYSAARRVRNLLGRVGSEPGLLFTGGVSNNPGMRRILEELIGSPFTETTFDMIYAGALGAAAYATLHASQERAAEDNIHEFRGVDLLQVTELIEQQQETFIDSKNDDIKVGYLCTYTPLELLNAAGVKHARLFKAGNPDTVAAGERFTQSVFCDFSKSCIGAFSEGDPLYKAIDKVYNFHTCASMKRASEVIEQFVPVKLLNLPKLRDSEASRTFFRNEIVAFRDDLEKLSGQKISDEAVQEQIGLYNSLRQLLKKFSELRKRFHPPLSGSEYLELVRAFYYVPGEALLPVYEDLYRRLSAVPDRGESSRLRLMIAGSIVADGDRRLLDIIEKELGLQVVVEDHCTGLKPFYHTTSYNDDPFQSLADGYLDQAPCARMKTLEANVEFSGRLAREYAADGVLYVYHKFCSCYGVTKKEFLVHFQGLDLPVLDISADYSESDHGQLKTRIEAFIEVLNAKRSQTNEPYIINA